MNPLTVNGHPLPVRLQRLMETGKWRVDHAKLSNALLSRGGPEFESAPYCMSAEEMESQLKLFLDLGRFERPPAPGISVWDSYGFKSSVREHTVVQLPWLDLDFAVPIILSTEEGPEVWLDYRERPTFPRVVAPIVADPGTGDRGRDFVVVEDSAADFLRRVVGGPGAPS